jgi:hypothetical protein
MALNGERMTFWSVSSPLTDAKIGNRFKRAAGEVGSLTLLE